MTITVVGEITLGSALPAVTGAYATALANIQGEIAAIAAFKPVFSPPGLDLEVNAEVAAGLTLSLSLGVVPPSIQLQIDIMLALLVKLELELQVLLDLDNLLRSSAFVYAYEGPTSAFGTELQAQIGAGFPGGAPGDAAFGMVLGATAPAAVLALKSLFKTTP